MPRDRASSDPKRMRVPLRRRARARDVQGAGGSVRARHRKHKLDAVLDVQAVVHREYATRGGARVRRNTRAEGPLRRRGVRRGRTSACTRGTGESTETRTKPRSMRRAPLRWRSRSKASTPMRRAVLEARMRVGSEDEGTVAAMGGLANALSEQGNHAEAKLLNEKALAISTRVLGADHITTLALRCISAWSLALKGDYADAVDETPCTRAC